MIKNVMGKTELLNSLEIGGVACWHVADDSTVDKQMKLFTATLTRFKGMAIRQKSALIVVPGMVPYHAIMIERIA